MGVKSLPCDLRLQITSTGPYLHVHVLCPWNARQGLSVQSCCTLRRTVARLVTEEKGQLHICEHIRLYTLYVGTVHACVYCVYAVTRTACSALVMCDAGFRLGDARACIRIITYLAVVVQTDRD